MIIFVFDFFFDLLLFICFEIEMIEDEFNVLRYFIFCVEKSVIEEIIVVNLILICWYFLIWNC